MTTASSNVSKSIELLPSYKLPIALIVTAVFLLLAQIWSNLSLALVYTSAIIALFGLFLWVQAATLRLRFTETDLDIYRGDRLIRRFPYQDWQNWQIFWSPLPILFYFKEVKSIHFLPVLFNAKMLQSCLEAHCPRS